MERFVKKFWIDDYGNATLDWLVLTAGLVLLGAALMAAVGTGSVQAGDDSRAIQTVIDA